MGVGRWVIGWVVVIQYSSVKSQLNLKTGTELGNNPFVFVSKKKYHRWQYARKENLVISYFFSFITFTVDSNFNELYIGSVT